MRSDIFHPDFKAQPWWWEAWTPNNALSQDPPARTDIVIVGAGYGGLSTALELRRNGVGAVVLERGDFGVGASTRNGGMISGGTNLGKGLGGKSPIAEEFERKKAELMGAGADSLTVLEDIIARERHRVRAAQERPLRRRLDAQALRRSRDQGRDLQQIRQCRQLDGAARTPARDDRLGLLLRRHACHARRPSPSRALLQGPARSRAPRRRDPVRQCRGRAHREDRDGLAGADLEGTGRVPRGRGRHQRLYRRPDAPAEAPRRAGGEPHHRHRGSARACRAS